MAKIHLPFREVHLDFHTSPDIPDIGKDFNADAFANELVKAHVNSITCFARCHHGMIYYDSKKFPERVHPHLQNKNLLKDQIEACHKNGIRVPVYTTVQWDDYTAKEHPEWLCVNETGGEVNWHTLYEGGFYRFLCVNSPYREFLKENTKEILEEIGCIDGLFFDITLLTDCSCKYCREKMEKCGYNPVRKDDRYRFAAETMDAFTLEMSAFVKGLAPDCSVFYNTSHVGPQLKKRKEGFTHYELESLPSGGWGYLHFPITMRYARNLGLDCLAQTGKFHTEWGDFHSFKNMEALEFECFHMLALNAKCMIGDQMEPNGVLSPAVYDLIGKVYGEVEKKEPYCIYAKAVADIGVFTTEAFTIQNHIELNPSMMGCTQMLVELGMQFEIIDPDMDFSRFKLLILPDEIPVNESFKAKLEAYLQNGGKIIATFQSLLNEQQTDFNITGLDIIINKEQTKDIYGDKVAGKAFGRSDYADYILPKGRIGEGLPETEHTMYIKGLEVTGGVTAEVLAKAVKPCFNRTYKHFCSHRQAPSSGTQDYDCIIQSRNIIYFAHPIFRTYRYNAPKWYKLLIRNAISMLVPQPLLKHNGPSTVISTLNVQENENRMVVHLLHYLPLRRCEKMDVIEDKIPVYHVTLAILSEKTPSAVKLVPENIPVPFVMKDGYAELVVEKIDGHQMIALEFA